MFNNSIRERLTPEQLTNYEKVLEKKNEADLFLKELRKMFSNLKALEKKYLKMLVEEEKSKQLYGDTVLWVIKGNVYLSQNKHKLIVKEIARFRHYTKRVKESSNYLQYISSSEQQRFTDGINRLSYDVQGLHSAIRSAEDNLRIANKHLAKITDYITSAKERRSNNRK